MKRFNAMTVPYQGPKRWRSTGQLMMTAGSFFLLWYLMLRSLEVSYILTCILALPTSGFLARLFMIQHDCGHGSFFRSRRAAVWVGHWIGVFTLVPYHYWRRTHALHHSHNGDLDLRGFGDVSTLTVAEYLSLGFWKRLGYRFYRHPFTLFGVGALWHFVVKHRYPWNTPRSWTQAWRSIWLTNLCIVAIVALVVWAVGWQRFLLVHGPVLLFSCSIGVWLFYVQHQFEETYWERKPEWDYFDAALEGSSHLVLPRPLQWLTASIGLHHVHHLSSRIPNYRLEACMKANPELQRATKIKIRDTWKLIRLTLWDEVEERLIAFGELRKRAKAT